MTFIEWSCLFSVVVSGGSLKSLNFTMSVKDDIFCRGCAAVYWMGLLTLLLECESVVTAAESNPASTGP